MQLTQNDYTLTVSEAAAMLGGTEKAIERLIFTARLDAVRIKGERGHEFRIRPDDILAQKADLEKRVADFDADATSRKRETEAERAAEPETKPSPRRRKRAQTAAIPEVVPASAPTSWTVSLPIAGPSSPAATPRGSDELPKREETSTFREEILALAEAAVTEVSGSESKGYEEPEHSLEIEPPRDVEGAGEPAKEALPTLAGDLTPPATSDVATILLEPASGPEAVASRMARLLATPPIAHVPEELFETQGELPAPLPEVAITRPYVRADTAPLGVVIDSSACTPARARRPGHDAASFDRAVAEALAATTPFTGSPESPGAAWVRNPIDWTSEDDAVLAAPHHPHPPAPETDLAEVQFPELADEALSVASNGKSRRGVLAEGLKRIGALFSSRK